LWTVGGDWKEGQTVPLKKSQPTELSCDIDSDNPFPQLPVISHITASYERCLEHRSRKLWNCLPKDWVLNTLSYNQFCTKVKDWIINQRDNDYVYY
jgi:hypothetical protein